MRAPRLNRLLLALLLGVSPWWVTAACTGDTGVLSLSRPENQGGESTNPAGGPNTGGTQSSSGGSGNGCDAAACPESSPYCLNGSCAECTRDQNCEVGDVCDLLFGECRDACVGDPDCDGRCSPEGFCVECLVLADCTNEDDRGCNARGECVDCDADDDCPSERPVCEVVEGECVECLSDADCSIGSCNPSERECG